MSFVCSNADLMLRVRSSPRTLMPAKKEKEKKSIFPLSGTQRRLYAPCNEEKKRLARAPSCRANEMKMGSLLHAVSSSRRGHHCVVDLLVFLYLSFLLFSFSFSVWPQMKWNRPEGNMTEILLKKEKKEKEKNVHVSIYFFFFFFKGRKRNKEIYIRFWVGEWVRERCMSLLSLLLVSEADRKSNWCKSNCRANYIHR